MFEVFLCGANVRIFVYLGQFFEFKSIKMELPKYHETFIPILKVLNSYESLKSRELASKVRDLYYSNLTNDLLNQKTSSGANVLLDRILWGKSYLKMAKFVNYPNRGMVKITEKGKKQLVVYPSKIFKMIKTL